MHSTREEEKMKDIDSQWLETKKHREHWQQKATRLKELDAPDVLVEEAERVSKLTHWEYDIELEEAEKLREQEIQEYAKKNPIKKSVVKEIYRLHDSLMERNDSIIECLLDGSFIMWLKELHPLSIEGFSLKDLEYCIYDPILYSLHDEFLDKKRIEFQPEKEKK